MRKHITIALKSCYKQSYFEKKMHVQRNKLPASFAMMFVAGTSLGGNYDTLIILLFQHFAKEDFGV